ncbi:MAG: response regulator [Alphaproteobacteria bacterium]|nr:response regulator [Alphaproteobacteria bacterium]MCW5739745.1 response regulator [Alphaproteobacteria bacterium]
MRDPARILVVDDVADNVEILRMRLSSLGYEVVTASDGEQALAAVRELLPDLVLLDIMMPKIDGLEVVRRLKADKTLPFIPVILVTARAQPKEVIAGLDAGGDDYLTKPVDHGALVARVRAMLRIKALHDEIETLNRGLERRVQEQVAELERANQLRRFLAPQLAQAIVSAGDDDVLKNHRREIVALFCDLRGFTTFSETAEPEDIMTLLGEFHGAVGPLIRHYEGTLDRFLGDGLMVFFNDPLPCPDAPARAAKLALEMRGAVQALMPRWIRRGHRLGFGIGMAQGYATLGRIGFEDRLDYTAIGAVVNLAARLCSEARDGEVLLSGRLAAAVEEFAELQDFGEREVRGMSRPVAVCNLVALKVTDTAASYENVIPSGSEGSRTS